MSPHRLTVHVYPFTKEVFIREVYTASKAAPESALATQVRFIFGYLGHKDATARTLVVEAPYVDRHFLEEYSNYYASTLHPPPPKATRLHFFSNFFTEEEFQRRLEAAGNQAFEEVCAELTQSYLGFTVIRPLPDAPIGRTVLATYQSADKKRSYTLPPHPYKVHLCGLQLQICGVPFQQQEQAVGACATSSLWCALAQVMRNDGGRAPTPFAVTEAATRHYVTDRVFPATSGLKNEQVLAAIRNFGYSPVLFEPNSHAGLFIFAIKCYLKSGIPVILKVSYPSETDNFDGHAVTVVGFRDDDAEVPPLTYQKEGWQTLHLRSRGLSRLYVHDDRLGPYARAEWALDAATGFIKMGYVYEKGDETLQGFEEKADLIAAMVPLYPKIRLSAHDMIGYAAEVLPFFRALVGPDSWDNLFVDLEFSLTGSWMRALFNSDLPAARIAQFAQEAVLSRYLGIIKFTVNNNLVAYMICDSTDLRREDSHTTAPLLAVLPRYEQHLDEIKNYFGKFAPQALVV